uniref:Uncharacterized protein n=1 Tax=Arundo donax TaxID=35708 RepID=A0A0A8ZB89_ARUDO
MVLVLIFSPPIKHQVTQLLPRGNPSLSFYGC